MAKLLVLTLSLCFLLFSGCFAFRQQPQQNECQLQRLNALEPDNSIKSEAGLVETWNPNNKQLRCVGVALSRCTLQRHGLGRPFYTNAPQEIYIQQGSGMFGMIFPGCPETYEEPQESERGQGLRSQDRHQKVYHFSEGDVIAVPTGVAFWMYNDEDTPVVAVTLIDTSNLNNQLDQIPRRFYLAGNQEQEFLQYQRQERQGRQGGRGQQQQEEEENEGGSIFRGFNDEILEEALNVDRKIVRNLKGENDDREGGIVKVKGGLSVISPPIRQQQQQGHGQEEEEEEQQQPGQQKRRRNRRRRHRGSRNGLEETICTMRLRQSIGQSTSPDIYNPQAGRIKTVTSLVFPLLWWLGLSAEHGSLYKNAMIVPHYSLNANSIIYVLKGRAWLQVVDCSGNAVFSYVAFKTNDIPLTATLAGRTSEIWAMPEEVVAQAYNLRRKQARQLKNNNPFKLLVPPREPEMRAVA